MGGAGDFIDDVANFVDDIAGTEFGSDAQQEDAANAAAAQQRALEEMQANTNQAMLDQQAKMVTDSRSRRKKQLQASRKATAGKRAMEKRSTEAANISAIAAQRGAGMSAGSSDDLRQSKTKAGYGKYKKPTGLSLKLRGSGGGSRPQ